MESGLASFDGNRVWAKAVGVLESLGAVESDIVVGFNLYLISARITLETSV
jgi:hypothetical protein